jgi:lipoate-protein ligase B
MNVPRFIHVVNLPVSEYLQTRQLQIDLTEARKNGRVANDVVLWLEHFPVFTLGRRGGRENLLVTDGFLEERGISVVPSDRGGDITYHAPGQLIAYPIIDLSAARLTVPEYVTCLEEVMIRTAEDYGVGAKRNPLNRGVWVGEKKLGSIGIAVRHGISFHGLAINMDLSVTSLGLLPFEWINPCGLKHTGVTSVGKESGKRIDMIAARNAAQRHMEKVFNVKSVFTPFAEIERHMAG